MPDGTKGVLDETNSVLLDADGMYFGLLTHPKEEEHRQKPTIAAVIAVILIVAAVIYYSNGDRYRSITTDINSARTTRGRRPRPPGLKPLWR